jgi:hypothetical protein
MHRRCDTVRSKAWQVSMFLRKHNIRFRKRNSNFGSIYFEAELDTVKLIRVADHYHLSNDIPWEPDYTIVTRGDYERMKRKVKKINEKLF